MTAVLLTPPPPAGTAPPTPTAVRNSVLGDRGSPARADQLGDLSTRLGELDREREMVVHCKSGVRSQRAIAFLRQQGFTKLHNLKGGILAWAERIDPTMARY